MKKAFLFFFSLLVAIPSIAQLGGNGYYRVMGAASQRYIMMVSNKSTGANAQTTEYDFLALRTVKPFEDIVDDPGCIFLIQKYGSGNEYNLYAQGTDAHALVSRYLHVSQVPGSSYYYAYGEAQGIQAYISDSKDTRKKEAFLVTNGADAQRRWAVLPVSASGDNYLGLKPEVTVGSQLYTSFYASFPISAYSEGMKFFTVVKVEGDMAVYQQVQGNAVPKSTPVIVQCAGAEATQNRLNILMQNPSAVSGNLLRGVYLNTTQLLYPVDPSDFHFVATPYDPNTMRLLGKTSDGKLGFVKSDVQYVPRNRAYLVVPAGSPDEIKLVTAEEYAEEIARDKVKVTANDKTRLYGEANPTFDYTVEGTLKGTPTLTCQATPASPVGTYPIVVSQGTCTNRQFEGVPGKLTVNKAPLTITARSYTVSQIDPLPDFQVDYAGFKNNETASVLTAQPQVTCELPTDYIPVGTYPITVSGAAAQNYDITYVPGTLTVTAAPLVTITATNLSMSYGDAVPQLEYTITGGNVGGEPTLSCEASSTSLPGTYDISVAEGTVAYPNLELVDGVLTIGKAPLQASVGTYVRLQGEENPEFEILYEGFRNGEDASILTKAPVATTTATADSPAGDYAITVAGGESDRYAFTYVNGMLTVQQPDGIQAVTFARPVDIYSLAGRLVRSQVTTIADLPRGVYVVNGRKLVVK
jgi:hypothetical protein